MAGLSDYEPEKVLACRSALIELARSLGDLGRNVVLIGGWAPYLLCGRRGTEEHVGSLDNDIVIRLSAVRDIRASNQIRKVLQDLNYNNLYTEPPHRFFQKPKQEKETKGRIILDLFTSDEGPAIPWSKERILQDAQLYKLKGAGLVFENPVKVDLSRYSSQETGGQITIRVVNPAVFITLKSFALGGEAKRDDFKDAYDIWFILEHYPPGLERILNFFSPIRDHEVVRESLKILAREYAGIDMAGPTGAAKFQDHLAEGSEEFERVRRRAYEAIQYLIKGIKNNESAG